MDCQWRGYGDGIGCHRLAQRAWETAVIFFFLVSWIVIDSILIAAMKYIAYEALTARTRPPI